MAAAIGNGGRGARPRRMGSALVAIGALGAFAAGFLPGCGKKTAAPAAGPGGGPGGGRARMEFPVEVEPVESRAVEYAVTGVGSVEAFETVAVTAHVAGVVERVRFTEGDAVGSDQVLAEIEPQRYRLQVDSAEASLAKAVAQRDQAALALERRKAVNAKNPDLVRQEDVDQFETQLAVARADVAESQAARELARLNLHHAFVRAPVAGIVQSRTVATGVYVQPGTVLATMVRREPLLLRFHVPEQEALPLAAGKTARFTVGGSERAFTATITNVGAAAAEASRMVEVTAKVDDPARAELRPGSFASVTVPIGGSGAAPVVPQTAVRPSERGFLAFVVEDGVAHERVLSLGLRTADGRVEVRSGLTAGETLVIRGAEALREGAAVKVQGAAAPGAAAPPATPATPPENTP